jgi:5-methylcytosine-specific restriction endonuclease McrA
LDRLGLEYRLSREKQTRAEALLAKYKQRTLSPAERRELKALATRMRCGHAAPRRSPGPHRMSRVSPALRRRVRRRAQGLCEYCRSSPELTGHDFTIDHILPESHGGASRFENLLLVLLLVQHLQTGAQPVRGPTDRPASTAYS